MHENSGLLVKFRLMFIEANVSAFWVEMGPEKAHYYNSLPKLLNQPVGVLK